MFNIGDKVVYVHNKTNYYNTESELYHDSGYDGFLVYGDVFTINIIFSSQDKSRIYFEFYKYKGCSFESKYFTSIRNFRKQKILKLNQ